MFYSAHAHMTDNRVEIKKKSYATLHPNLHIDFTIQNIHLAS
jgi:hypothetical protein